MKNMRRYLKYLEDYLNYEKGRMGKDDIPQEWKKRHACCCEIKNLMNKKFDELHEAFKPVDSKIRLFTSAGRVGCSYDWPSCASEARALSIAKKK